jgi:hypothetical protein
MNMSFTDTLAKIEAWFAKAVPIFENFILPIATVAVASIPGVPPIASAAMAQLPTLIKNAEAIEGATGEQKSAAVQGFFQGLMGAVGSDLTGGAAKTYATVQPIIQATINSTVAAANQAAAPVPAPASTTAAPETGTATGA